MHLQKPSKFSCSEADPLTIANLHIQILRNWIKILQENSVKCVSFIVFLLALVSPAFGTLPKWILFLAEDYDGNKYYLDASRIKSLTTSYRYFPVSISKKDGDNKAEYFGIDCLAWTGSRPFGAGGIRVARNTPLEYAGLAVCPRVKGFKPPQWILFGFNKPSGSSLYLDYNRVKQEGSVISFVATSDQGVGDINAYLNNINCRDWLFRVEIESGNWSEWEVIPLGSSIEYAAKILCK